MELVGFDQQSRLVGPDGTIVFGGAGKVLNPLEVRNNATTAITAGEAVRFDSCTATENVAGSVRGTTAQGAVVARIPRIVRLAPGTAVPADIPQAEQYPVLRVTLATNKNFLGVVQGDIPAVSVAGSKGVAAGSGSLVCVQCITPTSNTVGAVVIGSATVGLVDALAAGLAGAATLTEGDSTKLGQVTIPAGAAAATTLDAAGAVTNPATTGDTGQLGILVCT